MLSTSLDQLPRYCQLHILKFLSTKDKAISSRVNHLFKEASQEAYFFGSSNLLRALGGIKEMLQIRRIPSLGHFSEGIQIKEWSKATKVITHAMSSKHLFITRTEFLTAQKMTPIIFVRVLERNSPAMIAFTQTMTLLFRNETCNGSETENSDYLKRLLHAHPCRELDQNTLVEQMPLSTKVCKWWCWSYPNNDVILDSADREHIRKTNEFMFFLYC